MLLYKILVQNLIEGREMLELNARTLSTEIITIFKITISLS